jgi:hypothetical protein
VLVVVGLLFVLLFVNASLVHAPPCRDELSRYCHQEFHGVGQKKRLDFLGQVKEELTERSTRSKGMPDPKA